MKIFNPFIKRVILFIVITGLCGGGVMALYSMEPAKEIETKIEAAVKPVTVIEITPGAYSESINVFGEISPKWSTSLRAQASGKITHLTENLHPGHKIRAGETVMKIDQSVYLANVSEARLRVENANLQYLLEERNSEQAKGDWRRSGLKGDPSSSLVFYKPQLKVAKAEIEAAQKNLDKALSELDYTVITAPYDGLVTERSISKGDVVLAGEEVAKIISASDIEIKIDLSEKQVVAIGSWKSARLTIHSLDRVGSWRGEIVRDGGYLDSKTRLRSFYIVPEKGQAELLPGMFMSVRISGVRRDNLIAIPESALTRDGYIWYADSEQRLQNFKADVLFYKDREVFVNNVNNFHKVSVVATPLQSFTSGTQVKPVYDVEGTRLKEKEQI